MEKLDRKLLSGWIQARHISFMMLPFQHGGGTTLSTSYGHSVTEPPAVDSRQTNKRWNQRTGCGATDTAGGWRRRVRKRWTGNNSERTFQRRPLIRTTSCQATSQQPQCTALNRKATCNNNESKAGGLGPHNLHQQSSYNTNTQLIPVIVGSQIFFFFQSFIIVFNFNVNLLSERRQHTLFLGRRVVLYL